MSATVFYNPTRCCRSRPASCCIVSCRDNGAMTAECNLCMQVNTLVIEHPNKLLRLMGRQTNDSTSSTNRLIPIAGTLFKVHQ